MLNSSVGLLVVGICFASLPLGRTTLHRFVWLGGVECTSNPSARSLACQDLIRISPPSFRQHFRVLSDCIVAYGNQIGGGVHVESERRIFVSLDLFRMPSSRSERAPQLFLIGGGGGVHVESGCETFWLAMVCVALLPLLRTWLSFLPCLIVL